MPSRLHALMPVLLLQAHLCMAQSPAEATIESLLPGAMAGHVVRVKGTVLDVAVRDGRGVLLLADGLPLMVVTLPGMMDDPPLDYMDALVEVTGVVRAEPAPSPNPYRPWSGLALKSPDDLRVIKAGGGDVFAKPLSKLSEVSKASVPPFAARVRVIGKVTYVSRSGWFYMQDDTGTARGYKPKLFPPSFGKMRTMTTDISIVPGDVIEMTGQPAPYRPAGAMPIFHECEWRVLRHGAAPDYTPVEVAEVFTGNLDGKPVSIGGRVVGMMLKPDPDTSIINHFIGLDSFNALVQYPEAREPPFKEGQYVRLRGVLQAELNDKGAVMSFRVNVQSFDDIQRIRFAIDRVLFQRGVLGAAALVVAAVVWITMLRRQVRRQTADLRLANEELQRFKAVADSSTDLIAMASLDQRPLYFNPAGRELLRIPMDADAGEIRFDEIYPGETLELFEREAIPQGLERGHWSGEITMKRSDGSAVPVSFLGLIIKAPDGTPLYMSCIARDITEKQQLDQQLRDALDHERQLGQLKSSFVNTISHEFRTPLGIILFASSMMRRFDERFGPEERAGQLDAIDKAVEQMNELVEQALSLGRAEVAAPKKTRFDIRTFSLRLIDEVQSATSYRSPITLEAEEALPSSYGDETMLRTILVNLLGNAVKYSPAGSPIALSIQRVGEGTARFVVRDHGPGLSEEDLPKLFSTFHRGKGTEGIPGTGLGLAIVKRCTESLGGSVHACNAEGGGAEFIVEIPLFTELP